MIRILQAWRTRRPATASLNSWQDLSDWDMNVISRRHENLVTKMGKNNIKLANAQTDQSLCTLQR